MKLHPCPAQNSAFQASHCSALLMGYVKYCSRLYVNKYWFLNIGIIVSLRSFVFHFGVYSSSITNQLENARYVWNCASMFYAEQASGVLHSFMSSANAVNRTFGTFYTIDLPKILSRNGNAKIVYHYNRSIPDVLLSLSSFL